MIITVIVTTSNIYLCEIGNVPPKRTRMQVVTQLYIVGIKFL